MPSAFEPRLRSPNFGVDREILRCAAVARFSINGRICEMRCNRDGRHTRGRSGHICYFSCVDESGNPIKRKDGRFVRVKFKWEGRTRGEGLLTPENAAILKAAMEASHSERLKLKERSADA